MHALIQDAFAEIDGHEFQPLERWRAKTIGKDGHDPSLWQLLEDDEGLAGAALGERWEDGTGYVAELAVAGRARGRGHGRALLLGLFEAFRRRRPRARRAERARPQPRRAAPVRVHRHAHDMAGRALGEGTWISLTSPRSRTGPARQDASGSTRSSCPRGGTGRSCASCRSSSATTSGCSIRCPGSTPRRWRRCSPIPPWRSSCTPAARTWRSCDASGRPTSPTCSTRRWRPASPASPRRRATAACCTTC